MGIALRRLILSIKSVGWWGQGPRVLSFLPLSCLPFACSFSVAKDVPPV